MECDLYVSVRFMWNGGLIFFVWKIVLVVVSTTNKLIINFYLSVYRYICMSVNLPTHPPTYNPTYLHIYRHMCMRAYVHTRMLTYVHTYMHTHAHADLQIMQTIRNCGHNQEHRTLHFKCYNMDVKWRSNISLRLKQ